MAVADTVLTEVAALRATVRGEVLVPGDDGYDVARTVWNAMVDRRPAVIVRAAGVADVMTVVDFARAAGLVLSVRRGAHNVTGSAVCDDGVMLDMSAIRASEWTRSVGRCGPRPGACGGSSTTRPKRSALRSPAAKHQTPGSPA
jgi:hypothetical protein